MEHHARHMPLQRAPVAPRVVIDRDGSDSSSSSSSSSEKGARQEPPPADMDMDAPPGGSVTPRAARGLDDPPDSPGSPNKNQKIGERWIGLAPPNAKRPLEPPPVMPDIPALRFEAKRVCTEASSSSMNLFLQVYGMDLDEGEKVALMDEEQISMVDNEMWEEPELQVKEGLDPIKCAAGRQVEYQRLLDFGVIKVVSKA